MDERVSRYPLEFVKTLIVNETEGRAIMEAESTEGIADALSRRLPGAEIILTLGGKGLIYRSEKESITLPAYATRVVDSTAAGDTFVGFFLASRLQGKDVELSLKVASKAAAISVSRQGAMHSIPAAAEVTL